MGLMRCAPNCARTSDHKFSLNALLISAPPLKVGLPANLRPVVRRAVQKSAGRSAADADDAGTVGGGGCFFGGMGRTPKYGWPRWAEIAASTCNRQPCVY